MAQSTTGSYLMALAGVALVAFVTSLWLPTLGLASAALLFLLPVLLVAARGGIGPGLLAAGAGAFAYNFLLLPPLYTLRIDGFDNVVSLFVLTAVALVTSRLATALKAREAEARARAQASSEAAALAALLGRGAAEDPTGGALDWLSARYSPTRLIEAGQLAGEESAFTPLDLSAAAWAMHNADATGHGTAIMPAADWSFFPLTPHHQNSELLVVARPADATTRDGAELDQLAVLARLIGQARDRMALDAERLARGRLEDRDALRRTLLASLAHDFRTPLTVVAGELERLAKQDVGAASAYVEAQRLDRMMDDLIGAARIESGALAPQLEAVDLVDVVTDACAALALPLAGLKVARAVPGDLPLIEADPVLLRHILTNLLDNAAQHAVSAVSIAARPVRGGVELKVSDDGPGIPYAERQRIFERFERIEGSDRHGGSGLGLAIVKGFADAMAMTIDVTDAPERGSTFCLGLRGRPERLS